VRHTCVAWRTPLTVTKRGWVRDADHVARAGGPHHECRTAEFRFVPRDEGTVVSIIECGFRGTADEAIAYVADPTGGYTTALCGAKARLEHGVELGRPRQIPRRLGLATPYPCDRVAPRSPFRA
jgi:hypothetical protein